MLQSPSFWSYNALSLTSKYKRLKVSLQFLVKKHSNPVKEDLKSLKHSSTPKTR